MLKQLSKKCSLSSSVTLNKVTVSIVLLLLVLSLQSCITLTARKQTLTFTSTPSGAKVYGLYNRDNAAEGGYYIGTTPCTYKAKGGLANGFVFVKDGYYQQVFPAKHRFRFIEYFFGNWWTCGIGWFFDANKIFAYKQKAFNATLAEMPRSVVSQAASSTPVLRMPETFEASNARAEITPSHLSSAKRATLAAKQVYKDYTNAVFMVYGGDGESVDQGSGFVINSNGLAVSNYHVFNGMMRVGVKMFGQDRLYIINKQDIIAFNESEDYIIFKLPSSILSSTLRPSFTYIPVAKSKPEIGDKVYTIGSPKGLENTFSSGEVSAFRDMPYTIQINAPIDHGSSGGALINEYGEAIGITSAGQDDSGANLNFAIDLVRVLNKYK